MDQKIEKLNEAFKNFEEAQKNLPEESKENLDNKVNMSQIATLVESLNKEYKAAKEDRRKSRNKRKAARNKLKSSRSKSERRKANLVTKII